MGYIILASILGLFLVGSVVAFLVTREKAALGAVAGFAVLLAVVTAWSSFTQVEARSVAVETAFGRYVTTLEPGQHWIAPWSSTEDFTTTVQKVDFSDQVEGGGSKIPVAFKGGGGGWIDLTVNWHVTEPGVQQVWQNHRTFDGLNANFTNSAVKDAVVNSANDFTANQARADQNAVRDEIQESLSKTFASRGLAVDAVYLTSIPLDAKSQANLDQVVQAQNNVVKAEADKQRAEIDAQTQAIRAKAGSNSPEAITRYCLDIANAWNAKDNGPLPATFNCGLGSQAGTLVTTK